MSGTCYRNVTIPQDRDRIIHDAGPMISWNYAVRYLVKHDRDRSNLHAGPMTSVFDYVVR